jgi:hypothetical protein
LKRRSAFVVFLAILMLFAFSISGCTSKTTTEAPKTEAPAVTTPAETTPAETAPAVTTPAETAPAATAPAATAPAATAPAAKAPAATAPAAKTPTAAAPAAKTPAAAAPAAKTPAAAAPAAKAPETAAPAAKAPETVAPAAKAPETAAPAAKADPKADASALLAGCKYSGTVKGEVNVVDKGIPGFGDLKFTLFTDIKGNAGKVYTKGIPGLAGGDITTQLDYVPLNEIISGDKDKIDAFLKDADVSVDNGVITISNAKPPASVCKSYSNDKLIYKTENFSMSCKITVSGGAVKSITAYKLVGDLLGSSGKKYPGSTVAGSYSF